MAKVSVRRARASRTTCEGRHPKTFATWDIKAVKSMCRSGHCDALQSGLGRANIGRCIDAGKRPHRGCRPRGTENSIIAIDGDKRLIVSHGTRVAAKRVQFIVTCRSRSNNSTRRSKLLMRGPRHYLIATMNLLSRARLRSPSRFASASSHPSCRKRRRAGLTHSRSAPSSGSCARACGENRRHRRRSGKS